MDRLVEWVQKEREGYHPVEFAAHPAGDYVPLLERVHKDDGDFMEFIAKREFESPKEMLRLFQIPFPREGQEQKGMKLYGRTRKTVTETIRICKDKNVLREYLLDRERRLCQL